MHVHNAQPRPRAILEDLDDEVAAEVAKLFPSSVRVTEGDLLSEWEADVLVTGSGSIKRASHLHVVSFGAHNLGEATEVGEETFSSVRDLRTDTHESRSRELIITSDITGELGGLVRVSGAVFRRAEPETRAERMEAGRSTKHSLKSGPTRLR
ncbi:hypothetical protein UA74_15890 [Actinoalloteichus fjordicus]|uniref:Uncharacterized protein n=1 Tax=Actinoalloteichus fjordicus TaxID=1612552 RepID=A0AAC9LC33_9PSEU|nr:hypothetical protein UA74_15890 [Actinoalloteichus fjordicus]